MPGVGLLFIIAYSPGVAEPCLDIEKDKDLAYAYTNKGNFVAVVSNGTAVLFKTFAGVDAFPICIDTTDIEKVIDTVKLLEPTFGGINLDLRLS